MAKYLNQLIVLLMVIGAGVLVVDRFVLPCRQPVKYTIGEVDPRFGLDQDRLRGIAEQAEGIWERESARNLFAYDPQAKLKINMVFDERQQLTLEADALDQQKEDLTVFQAGTSKQYDALKSQYDTLSVAYRQATEEYEKDLDRYNKEVDGWNAQGGAPEDEYNQLKKERKKLKERLEDMNAQKRRINELAKRMNTLAEKEKGVVDRYNTRVEEHDGKVDEGEAFDQGTYTGESIQIYQFEGVPDLTLVLAHEMGHAIGIGHVENPTSVMYYLRNEQNMENPSLSAEDRAALALRCEAGVWQTLKSAAARAWEFSKG